jgi:alkylhydroperoxidase family enzyme
MVGAIRTDVPETVRRMVKALTSEPGDLSPEVRAALLDHARALSVGDDPPAEIPLELAPYVDKVTRWAYKVVDRDIDELRAAGWSEDAIFEATLCAATGAALARFERGLALLRQGDGHAA